MAKGKGSEEECVSVQLSSRWAMQGLKPHQEARSTRGVAVERHIDRTFGTMGERSPRH